MVNFVLELWYLGIFKDAVCRLLEPSQFKVGQKYPWTFRLPWGLGLCTD